MAAAAKHEPQPRVKSCLVCGKPRSHRATRSTCAECRDVPNAAPAIEMRQALARARDQGMTFAEAWPEALPAVLDAVPDRDRADWAAAFAWGRSRWRAAFTRTDRHVTHLATPDEDRATVPGVATLDRAA